MFDTEKLAQSVAWLLRKYGGRLDSAKLVKLMYIADREAIGETCIPITGDDYCSMKSGPVCIRLHALAQGEGEAEAQREWDALFGREGRDIVALKDNIPCDWLSERETDILDAVDARFHNMEAEALSEWTHNPENCPEWRKPNEGTLPIEKTDIMKALGFGEDDIDFALEKNSRYDAAQKSWELLRASK